MLYFFLQQSIESVVAQPENQIDITVLLANHQIDSESQDIKGKFQPAFFCLS